MGQWNEVWCSVQRPVKYSWGRRFTLSNTTPEDILFASVEAWYFHSHFQTDWFADLNYGAIDDAADSPAYKAISAAAKKWIDRELTDSVWMR